MPDCPFCHIESPIIAENDHSLAIRDGFPISPGHTLIIPRRHVAGLDGLDREERIAMIDLLEAVRADLVAELHPDGFNFGINEGEAAGQTIMHLHMHVIPRYTGDEADPRGGIRKLFPAKADYWSKGR